MSKNTDHHLQEIKCEAFMWLGEADLVGDPSRQGALLGNTRQFDILPLKQAVKGSCDVLSSCMPQCLKGRLRLQIRLNLLLDSPFVLFLKNQSSGFPLLPSFCICFTSKNSLCTDSEFIFMLLRIQSPCIISTFSPLAQLHVSPGLFPRQWLVTDSELL